MFRFGKKIRLQTSAFLYAEVRVQRASQRRKEKKIIPRNEDRRKKQLK